METLDPSLAWKIATVLKIKDDDDDDDIYQEYDGMSRSFNNALQNPEFNEIIYIPI